MNEKLKILNIEGCPSPDIYEQYLSGKLSDEQRIIFETHCKNCEFCNDAIGGYKDFKGQLDIHAEVNLINHEIDKITLKSRKNAPNSYLYYSFAAAVIIIITSIFVIRNLITDSKYDIKPANDELAVKKESVSEAEMVKADTEDVVLTEAEKMIAMNSSKAIEPKDVTVYQNSVKTGTFSESTDETHNESMVLMEDIDIPLAEKNKSLNTDKPVADSKKNNNDDISLSEIQVVESQNKKAAGKKVAEQKKEVVVTDSSELVDFYVQNAQIEYNKGNVANALELMNKAVVADPDNSEVLLNMGIMNYRAGNYKQSQDYLNQITNNKNNTGYEAKYFLALSYFEVKDFEMAKKWLKEVIAEGGKYKKKAEELLDKIE